MSIGPAAAFKTRLRRMSLSERVRATDTLLEAWHAIRRNGETSRSRKTREETKRFGSDLPRQLRRISEHLRARYEFEKPKGSTPPKKNKPNEKRPLVIAPIPDRIVQRAILDVLQRAEELSDVQAVLATPTSIGGIRGRGVEHAIEIIEAAHTAGEAQFVAGSDIAAFFTQIRQADVVGFIGSQTDDVEFVDLFARALKVDLANADEMDPDDRKLFPTDDVGVAQGCPLSAFAGNVALRKFDAEMNGRGVICVRYIDDFILLAKRRDAVEKAFKNAGRHLAAMGMSIYQPSERPDKAFFGPISAHYEFLGYQIVPGVYPPAKKNRDGLIDAIRQELDEGRGHILRTLKRGGNGQRLQYYAQSLVAVDGLLRAWSGSFRASRCERTANEIDVACDQLIANFIEFYRDRTRDLTQTAKRRVLGVHVLADDIHNRLQSDDAEAAAAGRGGTVIKPMTPAAGDDPP